MCIFLCRFYLVTLLGSRMKHIVVIHAVSSANTFGSNVHSLRTALAEIITLVKVTVKADTFAGGSQGPMR